MTCARCRRPLPSTRRADAVYCSERCRKAAEMARYHARRPVSPEVQERSRRRAELSMLTHDELLDRYVAEGGLRTTWLTDAAILDVLVWGRSAVKLRAAA